MARPAAPVASVSRNSLRVTIFSPSIPWNPVLESRPFDKLRAGSGHPCEVRVWLNALRTVSSAKIRRNHANTFGGDTNNCQNAAGVAAHPSDKNKDVARVGHPMFN